MQMREMTFAGQPPVDGYGPGFFRIAGEVIEGAAMILPEIRGRWQGYGETGPFLARAELIDVLFVGTGAAIAPLPPEFRRTLEAAGIGVEIMNSPTACRTYNVCLSEGRRVALAVLPV
ncbi:MAG: Mth938-like domain-containing protein [Gemmobacter sp.]